MILGAAYVDCCRIMNKLMSNRNVYAKNCEHCNHIVLRSFLKLLLFFIAFEKNIDDFNSVVLFEDGLVHVRYENYIYFALIIDVNSILGHLIRRQK